MARSGAPGASCQGLAVALLVAFVALSTTAHAIRWVVSKYTTLLPLSSGLLPYLPAGRAVRPQAFDSVISTVTYLNLR